MEWVTTAGLPSPLIISTRARGASVRRSDRKVAVVPSASQKSTSATDGGPRRAIVVSASCVPPTPTASSSSA